MVYSKFVEALAWWPASKESRCLHLLLIPETGHRALARAGRTRRKRVFTWRSSGWAATSSSWSASRSSARLGWPPSPRRSAKWRDWWQTGLQTRPSPRSGVPVRGQSPINWPQSIESSRFRRGQSWSPGLSPCRPNDVVTSAARDGRPSLRKAPDRWVATDDGDSPRV